MRSFQGGRPSIYTLTDAIKKIPTPTICGDEDDNCIGPSLFCESASNLDPWSNRYNALQLNSFREKAGVTVGRRSNAPEISNSTSASMIWCSTGVGSNLDADSHRELMTSLWPCWGKVAGV